MKLPSRRVLGIAVVASLALNLFLGGLMAGDWLMGRTAPPPFAPMMSFSSMRHALGHDARPMVEAVMHQHHESIQHQIDAVRTARRDVAAALSAEPFDRAQLETALARMRAEVGQAQTAFHGAFVDVVSNLTLDQRQQLAKESQRRRRPNF
ncbi:MAG: periplasmic heavy metal sensor [Alphaproteobacteria bacterium]